MEKQVACAAFLALSLPGVAGAGPKRPSPQPSPSPVGLVAAVKVPLPPPVRSLADLEKALADTDPAVRAAAALELAGAGVVPESVHNRLRAALVDDADARVRNAAVWAISHVAAGATRSDGSLQQVPYDEPPRLVQQARLAYPPDAFDRKVEGTVLVEILIDEEGNVARAEARESIPALDAAALAAVKAWKFKPAVLAGKPVATVVTSPVEFTIKK